MHNIYQTYEDRDQNAFSEYDNLLEENLPDSIEVTYNQRLKNLDQNQYQYEPKKIENHEKQDLQEEQLESIEQKYIYNHQNKRQQFQEANQYQNNERKSKNSDEDIVFKDEKPNSRFNNRNQHNLEWNEQFQQYMIPNKRHINKFYKNWRVNQPIQRRRNRIFFPQNRNQENMYENFNRNNALQHQYHHPHQNDTYQDGNFIINDKISDSHRNNRFSNQGVRPNFRHNGNEKKHNSNKIENPKTIQKQRTLNPRENNELPHKNVINILSQLSQEQLNMEKMIPKIRSIQNINKTQKGTKGQRDFIYGKREAQKHILNIQRTLETESKYKHIENETKSAKNSVSQINSKTGRPMFRSGQNNQEPYLSVFEKAANLIQKWAESQHLVVNILATAITDILKSRDLNLSPTNNVSPEKLVVIEDLVKQVLDAIKNLREGKFHNPVNGSNESTNKDPMDHINAVLQKWIQNQKTLIDSFLQDVRKQTGLKPEEPKPGLESKTSEIEIIEKLIKRLRELIEHLSEQKTVSSSTTNEQSTPKISSTTSEPPTTHTPHLTTEKSHPTTESSSTSYQSTPSNTTSSSSSTSTDKPPETTTIHITPDTSQSRSETSSTSIPTTSYPESTSIPSSTSTSSENPSPSDTKTTGQATDSSPNTTDSASTYIPTTLSYDTTSTPSSTLTSTDKPTETTTYSSSTTSLTPTSPTSTKTESESTKMTESSNTSHLTTETLNSQKASITKLKKILDLLKKLRKTLNTIVEKSDATISPDLIERVRSMLNQIITGQEDLTNTNFAELDQLISTTINSNTSKGPDFTKEKLIELIDNFEKLYQQLLEQHPSTTESTTGSTKTSTTITESSTTKSETSSITTTLATGTTTTIINSTTETLTTTSLNLDSSQSTINPTGAPSETNNNYNISGNLDLKFIVDGIQQLKMALYHDFNSFKKDQEDR